MRNLFFYIFIIVLIGGFCFAQPNNGEPVSSSFNAKSLFELAHELHTWPGAGPEERNEAMVMLNAVYEMDNQADYIFPEVIDIATKSYDKDYSDAVLLSLRKYLRSDSDLVPAMEAAKYLISRQNTREEREAVIGMLSNQVGARNNIFASEMATELGFLHIEKADLDTAVQLFRSAYQRNPFNDLAFNKIIELSDDSINPVAIAAHNRFMLINNPLDLDSAVSLAGNLYVLGLYNESYRGWKYAVDLLKYIEDGEIPSEIYIQWAMSALRSELNLTEVLQIAAEYRNKYGLNLLIEVLASKAAEKLRDKKLRVEILKNAEEKAVQASERGNVDPALLAWFYSFGKEDSDAALAWANKAYSREPNEADVQALLGYSLMMNQEYDLAREQLKGIKDTQIKLLGQAKIELAKDNKSVALEKLKELIRIDPGSIEAEIAINMLDEQKSAYIPEVEPKTIREELQKTFGNTIVEDFTSPEEKFDIGIKTGGNEFSFDHDIDAELIITNKGDTDIIVNDNSIFKGNILFSAKLNGDINAEIPELLRIKKQPSEPIKPGRSMIIEAKIVTGPLREILYSYPQAGFEIELTAYLDPVKDENDKYSNYIPNLEPITTVIKRNPVILSNRYLQSRLEAINKGQQGQVIRSVKLFAGLLAEQAAFKRTKEPLYRVLYAEPPLLKSALAKALRDDNWTIQFQTMLAMQFVPIEHQLASVLSELIQDDKWPVRMLSLNLLANSQDNGFEKVLDWAALNDPHRLVKQMATALGGESPEENEQNSQ